MGVFDDHDLNECYQTLNERVLNVLAQRNVDDVIIGAPLEITESLLDGYKINKVIMSLEAARGEFDSHDNYKIPAERGILSAVEIESQFDKHSIIERIIENQE